MFFRTLTSVAALVLQEMRAGELDTEPELTLRAAL